MTRSGIPYKYACKLFDYMLLTPKSDDIFDFPFIEAKGGYMISYAVLCGGLSGLIVGSRINQPDIAFSDRGKFFENHVRNIFKEQGLPHVQLHLKTGSNEYECDLAFVLNDVLFTCELKDTGSRQIREGEINFYENDVEQIDRIGSFFQMHEDYVKGEFLKVGYKVKYKTVIKLLIYNTHFHGVIHSNNIRVMGIDTFIAPIRRSPLDIRVCGLYGEPIECLQGDFIAKKFLQYMKHTFNECDYENMWYIHEYNFNVGNVPIKGEFLTAKPFDRREINEIIDPMPDLF